MISATVVGNLGKDAELRQAGSDNVCSFSVASSTKQKDKELTTWVRCSIWGKRGESLVKHLKKGTKVAVSGSLSTREHEGKTYVELRVEGFEFAGGGRGENTKPEAAPSAAPGNGSSSSVHDPDTREIPF